MKVLASVCRQWNGSYKGKGEEGREKEEGRLGFPNTIY